MGVFFVHALAVEKVNRPSREDRISEIVGHNPDPSPPSVSSAPQ
jgi:hypothetical protein